MPSFSERNIEFIKIALFMDSTFLRLSAKKRTKVVF